MLAKHPHLYLRILRPLLHAVLLLLVFRITYKLRLVTDLIPGLQLAIPPIDKNELQWYAIFSTATFVVIALLMGCYELTKPLIHRTRKLTHARGLWFVIIGFAAYFGHGIVFVGGISRLIILWSVALFFVLLLVVDTLREQLIQYFWQHNPSHVLCIYQDDTFKTQLEHHFDQQRYYYVTYVHSDQRDDVDYQQYHLVVACGDFAQSKLQAAFDDIRLAHQELIHIAPSQSIEDVVYQSVRIGDLSAYHYTPSTIGGRQQIAKRIIDIAVSVLALIILAPIMLIIALLIKKDSPGPVFYKHTRIGRGGQPFTFVKFRSMYTHLSTGEEYGGDKARAYREKLMDSDANIRRGELQKIKDDPRITRIGKFLRKTSLDELPNFFLVFQGTMSLIGPRPHEPFEVARYKPRQKRLLSMKPGVTGYAQIHGRDTLTFDAEATYDLHYAQYRSLRLDLRILLMTIKVVIKGR